MSKDQKLNQNIWGLRLFSSVDILLSWRKGFASASKAGHQQLQRDWGALWIYRILSAHIYTHRACSPPNHAKSFGENEEKDPRALWLMAAEVFEPNLSLCHWPLPVDLWSLRYLLSSRAGLKLVQSFSKPAVV